MGIAVDSESSHATTLNVPGAFDGKGSQSGNRNGSFWENHHGERMRTKNTRGVAATLAHPFARFSGS